MVNMTNLKSVAENGKCGEVAELEAKGSHGIEEGILADPNRFRCQWVVCNSMGNYEGKETEAIIRGIPRKAQWDCSLLLQFVYLFILLC